MSAFNVAAAPPAPTGAQILANLRRLLQPIKIRSSPAVTAGVAIAVLDGPERVIVCSWQDRDAIRAALLEHPDSRFVLDESSVA